ncbi:MAG: primosomal protein N' [Deltaproteobacteria bacterium]|nr:MAG: primosomal protein N' [Deltaproteobacteria bacterium]
MVRFTSDYYRWPLGEVIRAALPPGINLRSERRLQLTEEGRVALGDPATPPEDRDLLDHLSRQPGQEARVGARARISGRQADRLIARGWARRVEVLGGGRIRPATVEYVRPDVTGEKSEAARAALARAPAQLAVFEWLLARGEVPLAELKAAFPRARQAVRRLAERGLVVVEHRRRWRAPEGVAITAAPGDQAEARAEVKARGGEAAEAAEAPSPTPDQRRALETLVPAIGQGFRPFLLEGVTGSGKTEVYMRLIEAARAVGLGALVLVPEIALTPQLVGRFKARFGTEVAVLHSGLSEGERHDEWFRLREGRAHVAVGVRSAVFAPVERLGVIVVDEEHDPSFKQEEGLRYHARDLALVRGRQAGAVVLLGSATPSLETVHNVATGRFERLRLPRRIAARPMPEVEVVDLRALGPAHREGALLSPRLLGALRETVAAGQQAILFLNRRGHTPALIEAESGLPVCCPSCDVSLTLHQRPPRLLCHYCGFERAPPAEEAGYARVGVGTEQVEEAVREAVPGARVLRLDRDSTARKGALARILARFARGEANVLVGTQMVTKGHDFPGVTLVGVVLADLGLHVPDFRAAERTFQLLSQVAGRAGRGEEPGRVILQTYWPEHPAILHAVAGRFDAFARQERAQREAQRWPPACRLLLVRLEGNRADSVEAASRRLACALERAALAHPEAALEVLGPAPAPLSRLRGRTRWQVLVKAPAPRVIAWAAEVAEGVPLPTGVTRILDVDPVGML